MKPHRMLWFLFLVFLVGCAHPISQGFRQQVDPALTFQQILKSPQNHIGEKIILGGVIVETRNREDATEIEVVQKNLDGFGYPVSGDESQGRFLLRKPGYLESEIYSKGRDVTGAGTFVGMQKGKIGEVEYEFPVVEVEELKLWNRPAPYYGYPPAYPYTPYWYYWGGYGYPYRYYGPYYPYYY